MRVLLWHLDGKLPNLALMRLAAHHRERGDTVELRRVSNGEIPWERWRAARFDPRKLGDRYSLPLALGGTPQVER